MISFCLCKVTCRREWESISIRLYHFSNQQMPLPFSCLHYKKQSMRDGENPRSNEDKFRNVLKERECVCKRSSCTATLLWHAVEGDRMRSRKRWDVYFDPIACQRRVALWLASAYEIRMPGIVRASIQSSRNVELKKVVRYLFMIAVIKTI
jgi:hypothetical protein